MQAIVLVGGEGTRLRPLTTTTPKPLLPIVEVTFLERQLQWLAGYGVDDVVLSLGYLPDAFINHFPSGRFENIRLRYVVESTPLGTAGAIRFAADEAGLDSRTVVCNGDVLTSLNLSDLERFHNDSEAEATISLTWVDDPSAFGVVETAADGRVKQFIEKPRREDAPTQWINSGTYILEPAALARIPTIGPVSIERETFPQMLADKASLYAFATKGYWIDIGTPEKYRQAHIDVLAGVMGVPPAPNAREISAGCWWVSAGAENELPNEVELVAPVFIGNQATLGQGASVASSVVGADTTVGPNAVILRSVLQAHVNVGEGAQIVDSIVAAGAVIGAGASVANDSIIGEGAQVAPGASLDGARLEPGSRAD